MEVGKNMSAQPEAAAMALAHSDRTCCVCRVRGKPVALHTVSTADSNADAPPISVVLCLDCRNNQLPANELQARHQEWVSMVACEQLRTLHLPSRDLTHPFGATANLAEVLRDNQQYELLALLYHECGVIELRDKYIEKALAEQKSARAAISLRALQGRLAEVDSSLIVQELERHQANKDWLQLARLQIVLEHWSEAAQSYCRGIIEALACGDTFSAGSIIQEMTRQAVPSALFEAALRHAADDNNFWWEVKCLQAMGWREELRDYVANKQAWVEKSGDLYLQLVLSRVLNNEDKVLQLQKRMLAEAQTY